MYHFSTFWHRVARHSGLARFSIGLLRVWQSVAQRRKHDVSEGELLVEFVGERVRVFAMHRSTSIRRHPHRKPLQVRNEGSKKMFKTREQSELKAAKLQQ